MIIKMDTLCCNLHVDIERYERNAESQEREREREKKKEQSKAKK